MDDSLKQLLERIAGEKAPGPSPTFSIFHLLLAFELIAEKKIGRAKLAENLNVGEGAIRTIINRLKAASLIETSKTGCFLSRKGLAMWEKYKSIFKKKVEIGKNELSLGNYNFAILVKNRGFKVKSGVEQRDAAIIAGAKGATTMTVKKEHLIIPSVSDNVAKDFPNAATQIVKLLEPKDNDVVIIVSADTLKKAEYGTLAAAWTLFDEC